MNYFELNFNEFIIDEFKFNTDTKLSNLANLKSYLQLKNIETFNFDTSVIDCWEFQCDAKLLIFGYNDQISQLNNYVINIYKNSRNVNSNCWCHSFNINLSQFLSYGLQVQTVLFCNQIENSDILIIFFASNQSNHLVRFDLTLNRLTDLQSFSQSSIFIPRLSANSNSLDVVIEPNETITVVLINQNNDEQTFVCPSISELESVLNKKFITAVQELFKFWLSHLSEINQSASREIIRPSLDFIHNGINVSKYLNFLFVHQYALLDVIWNLCSLENSLSSFDNRFVEQLSNLTNGYVNEAINIMLQLSHALVIDLSEIKIKYPEIQRLFDLLCDNGHRFRKLVLSTRWSLAAYKRRTPIKRTLSPIKVIRDNVDGDNWKIMEKNEIIKRCLLTRQVGSLKLYLQETENYTLTESEIIQQTRHIILLNIDKCSWSDLIQLIKKLGYEPTKTLTSLYLETDVKHIRDLIYLKLDLEEENPKFKYLKSLVDKLENAFCLMSVDKMDENRNRMNSNLYSYIQPFIDRLDKSTCKYLRNTLSQSVNENESQSLNLKLNWFMKFYEKLDSEHYDEELLDTVDICLIDIDYKNFVRPKFHNSHIYNERIKQWLVKWKNKESLLLKYVTFSNNDDLIIAAIELGIVISSELSSKIIDKLITMFNSSNDTEQFTQTDLYSATNVLTHLFIHQPKFFISKVVQFFPNNLSCASDIILNINRTLPIHLMCSNKECVLNVQSNDDSGILSFIKNQFIENIISNRKSGEFPILLHYILEDTKDLQVDTHETYDFAIRNTFLLNWAIQSNSAVELFKCLLSQNLSDLNEREYTMTELDEILYSALLAGIPCHEISSSTDECIVKLNNILVSNDYWKKMRTRLLRPRIASDEFSNVEQYYEINLYNFLYRSGIPLSLENLFFWQTKNGFTLENLKNNHVPTISYLDSKHRSLFESPKHSLDYFYYLSHGRPYQAFNSIVQEFSNHRKPYVITQDFLKDIVSSISQIALSNISNEQVIGSCFALLRMIGSNTEPLRCYLTLTDWVIEWHVMSNEQTELVKSTGSQPNADEMHKYYEIETGNLFKTCFSKISFKRKRSRELLLRQLEEIFLSRLRSSFYTQLSEIIDSWSFVLYFCQLQGLEFSTVLLQYYAQENEWLLFLCCAQIFGYSKDQVKLAVNKFDDICIRRHMTYITLKVEDFSVNSSIPSRIDDSNRILKRNSMAGFKSKMTSQTSFTSLGESDTNPKEVLSAKPSTSRRFNRTTLQNLAKDNLIELIFDCQINYPMKGGNINLESISSLESIKLNSSKLLAFSIVLNNPFLAVLAFCSENSSPKENSEANFGNYLNCVSCFILSSFPKKILKVLWSKWDGMVKYEWNEEETIELIVYAIKNRLTNTVADAFFVLRPEKYDCVPPFYSMMVHAVDIWNPVQRESYLIEFVRKCALLCKNNVSVRERSRSKLTKDASLLFFNRLLEVSLLTGLNTIQSHLGSRFLYKWLESLSSPVSGLNQIQVKQLFSFAELNISLLNDVCSLFYDYIDLDNSVDTSPLVQENQIPVNVKSKEFVTFFDTLITKIISTANSSLNYTKSRLVSDVQRLMNKINEAPASLLKHYDKRENLKSSLKSIELYSSNPGIIDDKSITDLVSMAFVGQNDKETIVHLCLLHEQKNESSLDTGILNSGSTNTKVNHGTTDSWRRLVIPEEWQECIFSLSEATCKNTLDEVSHVNCLLNEKKWIEACSYMVENKVYVKDAILILIAMTVACGKTDPTKLPSHIKDFNRNKHINVAERSTNQKIPVRRLSVFTSSTTKLSALTSSEFESSINKLNRPSSRVSDVCQQFLRNTLDVVIHGQEIVEYIFTIYCVANKMTESYLTVAKGEEFNVLTKILVGTCREKIDTADMYLGVVDIDTDKLSRFLAEIIVQVLRAELRTHLAASTVCISSLSISGSQTDSLLKSGGNANSSKDVFFTISPRSHESSRPSPGMQSQKNDTISMGSFHSSLHEYVLKVSQRCQLRRELSTMSLNKQQPESRLMKAFYLQDLLILTPCSRKLGKILFEFYQHFSQEVFSCKEDAEFLVLLLIQCHNCFTEGGDTVGISHCLRSAKELSKTLTANSYFILLAQLLCRIGRYGEMPYIFTALIENEHFELLLRKDMDKEGTIVPYILDYLSRYFSNDYEKIELVCHKYNCNYELAETKSRKANSLIEKIKSQHWKSVGKDNLKIDLSSIITNLLESCKNYFKVGCYKKVQENLRKSQFYKLQYNWIEDSSKTFPVCSVSTPIIKSMKQSSNKAALPETGFPGGVKIISMNGEEAMCFIKRIPNFYTAFIIVDQLKLSGDVWIDLIVHHVLLGGDETFLDQFLGYFGSVLSANFVQQCSNKLEKLSTITKQNSNFKLMLRHCDDVFLVKRLSEKFQLNR